MLIMNLKILNKSKGFTLAEVLITLLIIGIIASMVIPSIIQDTQNAELKSSFKKAYGVASQAWKLVVAENPGSYTGSSGWSPYGSTIDGRIDAFKAKFSVVKTCINQDGCWPVNYENPGYPVSSGAGSGLEPRRFSWIASDGMCWAAPWYNADDCHILVDTNCDKKPNLIGKDIFSFMLGVDGVVYFAIDDTSASGKPISSGKVGPWSSSPATINGRSIDFKDWLIN
jgi:prepilin-type N-terminal cleavage/methylation domain-containing protein